VATVTETDPAERAARTARVIQQRRTLPGGRAVLGGLLVAVAAVGVFTAYAGAGDGPSDPVVVAARSIRLGEALEADDLRVVEADLTGPIGTGAYRGIDELIGQVALGPIGEGEVVQAGSVSVQRGVPGTHEIEIRLPRQHIAVGRLKQGERVDVFVTREERTTSVVRAARVVQLTTGGDGSLTSEREVSLVVAVPSGDVVAALVHALRTGDVTVVRATFASGGDTSPLDHEAPAA
jgi:Flp pilus assembly protein CpaB